MKPWKKIAPDETIKIDWRTLVRKTFETPDGKPSEYLTKEAIGSRGGAVIALTPENKVIVAEQFRQGPEKVMIELPGGYIDAGEDPLEAVKRELREETGYTSHTIELIGSAYKDSYTNMLSVYYFATDCYLTHEQELDEHEFINVKLISIDELLENAQNTGMTDTGALFFAYERLMERNKEG